MFTGLVESVGKVVSREELGHGALLWIETSLPLGEVALGDSIACDGVCLTVEELAGERFRVTAGVETMECTTLGALAVGSPLHLERAMAVGDRFGGHMVSGHVDGVGTVISSEQVEESRVVWLEVPEELARYVAVKGSVTVDGVSLTVNEVEGARFRVNLIPHTIANTHMGEYVAGSRYNVEVDLVARYVERLIESRLEAAGKGGAA